MDYLLKYNFSDKFIEKLTSFYDVAILELLEYNYDNVEKVIKLLEKKGIENIESIFFMSVDTFFKDPEELEEIFNKKPELVEMINEDVENIYEL